MSGRIGRLGAVAILAALAAPGMQIGGANVTVVQPTPGGNGGPSAPNSGGGSGQSERTSVFAGGGMRFGYGRVTYRKPGGPRKVAWDKRDALKRRNRLRAKGQR